jgi:hypothetical protein
MSDMSVEKLIISKDASSFTTIPNKVLQGLQNMEALGLWCYLASLPPSWEFYKEVIREHCNLGRDKLDQLLKLLESHNLLSISVARDEKGKFSHLSVHIKNGEEFISIENKKIKKKRPFTDLPLTDNQLLVNSSYKENINKLNIKTNKTKISPAPKVAEDRFQEFYDSYPKKKDREAAHKAWKKNKCNEIADRIIEDVKTRARLEQQWQDKQFIPYPSTYLNRKMWTDEIISSSSKKIYKPANAGSAFSSFINKSNNQNVGVTYDEHGQLTDTFG